jgi:hypothetical protein
VPDGRDFPDHALGDNLLYRWFVGLSPDDPVWDPTTFTRNVNQRVVLKHRSEPVERLYWNEPSRDVIRV